MSTTTKFSAKIFFSFFTRPFALGVALFTLAWFLLAYHTFFAPPEDFPTHSLISIAEGMTLSESAGHLAERRVIRSPLWFKALVYLSRGEASVVAGDYYFERPAGLLTVTTRIINGGFGIEPIRVLIPEGLHNREMAELLDEQLPAFDAKKFIDLAKEKEGYLFPDTYNFTPGATAEDVVERMHDHFFEKIEPIRGALREAGRNLHEVVTMASLLEREARTYESKQVIAGILWKRLEAGMPLQVDAVFPYLISKNTYEVTLDDLAYDSPYNTYRYAGLPPGPIANPGLDSIKAAIYYRETPYWYYLSDSNGTFHFAEDFEEHVLNKEKYLR